jgi:hypothetical protein
MKLAVVGLGVAALVTVGRAAAQSAPAQGGSSTCAGESIPAGMSCTVPRASDPSQNDLTPTQWLFGRDLGTKLTQTPTMSTLTASDNYVGWATVRAQADHALSAATKEVRSETAQRTGAADAAQAAPTPVNGSLTPQRFLVEEWRRTEIGVADSVYHDALMRITATFDSAQHAPIDDAQRTIILRRLDALLDANNYTWVRFRSQIMQRADSALATIK